VFHSQTGGIGRLPNLPVLVVSVPVLPGVAVGTTLQITFESGTTQSGAIWTDAQGVQYSIVVSPGRLPYIQTVTPGGGPLLQGAIVRIDGTGFTAGTTVQADGVSIASTQFVNSQQINLTLGAPVDLTAKRIVIKNPDDLSSQVLRIGCDSCQSFGRGMEEDAVDDFLVLIGDHGDLFRHREYNRKIGCLQKLGLRVFNPLRPG
jgi:hypothetical protein